MYMLYYDIESIGYNLIETKTRLKKGLKDLNQRKDGYEDELLMLRLKSSLFLVSEAIDIIEDILDGNILKER